MGGTYDRQTPIHQLEQVHRSESDMGIPMEAFITGRMALSISTSYFISHRHSQRMDSGWTATLVQTLTGWT